VPIVVTGFEPCDILEGVLLAVQQLEAGRHTVENQYRRAVQREGNSPAQRLIESVFEPVARQWRGMGEIARSGLALTAAYRAHDAEKKFGKVVTTAAESGPCISGEVLQGLRKPSECPAFGKACSPEHPLGATMVSSEGACAAYYRYRVN
jgi:hydrogenase expression/formation protein HypD